MNHSAFFKSLKEESIATCYLLEGTEEYIKETALRKLEDALLAPGMEQLNASVLDNPKADELIAAAETLPFMADRRLVVVRGLSALTQGKDDAAQTDKLIEYLPNITKSACLVFYVQGKADGRKRLYTALKKHAAVVSFEPLRDDELIRWIMQTIKSLGKAISSAVAQELAFTVGNDATQLRGEMDKLVAYAGEQAEITGEHIRQVAVRSLECTVFDMVDALVNGDAERAFALFAQLLRTGGDRVGSLAMILRQYRLLFHLKVMKEKRMPTQELRSRLAIPSFAADRAEVQARAYSAAQLREAMLICVDTDYQIKSGKLPQDGAVEGAMLRLARLRKGE